VSPGLAIAERIAEIAGDAAPRVVFACSDRAVDAHMLRAAGARYVALPARPASLHPRRAIAFARGFRASRRRCRALIESESIDLVLALGGFVSAPAAAAARDRGVPVTLVNLDRPPGRANRWLARRCERVWTAVELPDHPGFAERVVGLPVRRAALAPDARPQCRRRLGLDEARPVLLVTGASQGATTVNDLVTRLAEREPAAFAGWQVVHLTGSGADGAVRAAYARAGVPAMVAPFLDEIGLAWGAADLAVSRAGANSVAEAAANAVPTVFLPYPFHRDLHQLHNARPLETIGGAVIERDLVDREHNVGGAGRTITALLRDEPRRAAMRNALDVHRPDDAATLIATLLLESALTMAS
jgi:UDP-N-acetylglucosamine--N-acetylmuramyl-(pentapeptide) pyrophosphoryl-undecaprenol N-acetylglucosamine transferase